MTPQQTKTRVLISQLRTVCEKYTVGQGVFATDYVYLEKPVKIGENDNGDILCNGFHTGLFYESLYQDRNIVLNLLFDENQNHESIYSRDYNFSYVGYLERITENDVKINLGIHDEFNVGKHSYKKFEIFENALELVLDAITQSGQIWLTHQFELIKRSKYFEQSGREYYREGQDPKKMKYNYSFLSWDERIEMMKNQIEMSRLRHNHEIYHDTHTLKEMLELGIEEFDRKQEEQRIKFNEIMAEIMDEKTERNQKK